MQLLQKPAASGAKSWPGAVLVSPAGSDTNRLLYQITDRLVRDLLNKELAIQQLHSMRDRDSHKIEALKKELAEQDKKLEALLPRKDQGKPAVDPTTVQDLQKQLAERDRKIEELSTQLEALKRIDQEMREKVRPIRPPSTAAPGPTPDTVP
jgi:predicted RNase H-like nuclease (RuvC/YqgF family)